MRLAKSLLLALLVAVLTLAAAILYFRSGTTYYSDVGFGSQNLTMLAGGAFYYDSAGDLVDSLGNNELRRYAFGFVSGDGRGLRLNPLGSLSSDDLPPFLGERLVPISCSEREYLISEGRVNRFLEWQRESQTITDPVLREMQPFLIRAGDAEREAGECVTPEDVRWLARHLAQQEGETPEERERLGRPRFRSLAALHKAGLPSNP